METFDLLKTLLECLVYVVVITLIMGIFENKLTRYGILLLAVVLAIILFGYGWYMHLKYLI
jgi:hypothetical protein